jgi:DeoR/GlpR family transcriptional regulator of sugar metabolism
MLTRHRKQHILRVLARDGQVIAKLLSEELGLSEDTIRRDLRDLAARGLLQRVHGGALPASPAVADLGARRDINIEAKRSIGRAAARLLGSGQVAIIDGGTTTRELVRSLDPDFSATVITHSPTIAAELEHHSKIEIVLIGGTLFKHSMVTVGASAVEAIGRIRADIFFMGVTGIHAVEGLTTGDFEEAAIKRALMRRASETIVLASNEKLGAVSLYQIAPIGDLSGLVVDRNASGDLIDSLDREGVTIIRA